MTIDQWLQWAKGDAAARGVEGLPPLLEGLAQAIRAVREADWNATAERDVDVAPAIPVMASLPTALPLEATIPSVHVPDDRQTAPELLSLTVLAGMIQRGEISVRALVDACLARIERLNPSINAMISTLADRADAAAARADADRSAGKVHGPLHGIPLTLKDLIDVTGVPTTAASAVRRGHIARRDATVTRRLLDAGAIIVGKTNLHEFAFGTTNEDSAYGPALHPVDPARSPGGSSGGSAAAIRTGMCVASIGTDTGGSIRIPAAACGIVGLKATFGEIPVQGVVPLAASLDHVGPLTRSVEDAWTLWNVLRGEPRAPQGPAAPRLDAIRVGVLEPYFCDLLETGVRRAFFAAVDGLRQAGVGVDTATVGHAALTHAVYLVTVMAEAMSYHAATLDARPQDYTPSVRVRLEMGRYVLGEDYARAMRGRDLLTREVDACFETADVLVLPALPMAAPVRGTATVLLDGRQEPLRNATLRLTQLFDLTGHPAITIPIGEAEPGFPAGLQIVGRRFGTASLLLVARAIEAAVAPAHVTIDS